MIDVLLTGWHAPITSKQRLRTDIISGQSKQISATAINDYVIIHTYITSAPFVQNLSLFLSMTNRLACVVRILTGSAVLLRRRRDAKPPGGVLVVASSSQCVVVCDSEGAAISRLDDGNRLVIKHHFSSWFCTQDEAGSSIPPPFKPPSLFDFCFLSVLFFHFFFVVFV